MMPSNRWRRLLRVPWTARRSNQSVLKEINLEYSLKELVLKLKLQYFTTWCEEQLIGKDPNSGKDWGQEEKGTTEDEMVAWHLWLKGHEFEQALGTVKDREAWHAAVAESDMTERLNSDNQESYSTGNKWAVHISHFLSTFVCSLTFPASSLMASIVQNAVLWSRA